MSGKSTYTLFIFDFDGTLGDTSDCVVASFQGALKQNNLPVADRQEIVHYMGISLPEVFKRLTNHQHNDEQYGKLVDNYRSLYRTYLTQKTKAFPYTKEILKHIKDNGGMCTIATSKKTEFATLSCEFLELHPYIDLYIGDDKVQNKKPHPEMIEYTLSHLNVDPKNALMIGDATTDIEMGKAAGIDTMAVTWGAHSREALAALQPDYTIDNMRQLTEFIM